MADDDNPGLALPVLNTAVLSSTEHLAIDPDIDDDDNDSALGGSINDNQPSSASIASTIFNYRKLHGRTFHNFQTGDLQYWGPNDEEMSEGMDYFHHALQMALDDKLFLAPLDNPQRVLDVGAGTGMWTIDFADSFPSASVTGIDLSPMQPSWIPPNCKFIIDDLSQPWAFPDNYFDFIHIRYMMGCFRDWTRLYKECFRCLKPGGWLQHGEPGPGLRSDDGTLPEIWNEWTAHCMRASEMLGQPFDIPADARWPQWLEDGGFPVAGIRKKTFHMPVGMWPAEKKWKTIGALHGLAVDVGLEGFVLYTHTRVLGWEYSEVQAFLAKVRAALRSRRNHTYVVWTFAWVQKPLVE
ncbi:S-adenosyl-L-methionine-dependent methyltransferase [Schizothecium vesticola]|uniref:S-adenosyl-L-methionine-dependent methyltransferase n=1 Tax=Schizothecium vesticola TaxID=314040 RepID=A0AA40F5Q9_9PEZI|nr:S-adenosyl-L-methionine-dependent methyltransferase [Schizothecium vesticola]